MSSCNGNGECLDPNGGSFSWNCADAQNPGLQGTGRSNLVIHSWITAFGSVLLNAGITVVSTAPFGIYPLSVIGPLPLLNCPTPLLYPSPVTFNDVVHIDVTELGVAIPGTNLLLLSK